ncbi:MAG TPA: VWA domain-containing protein [Pyrinomonadaceae bacterium]
MKRIVLVCLLILTAVSVVYPQSRRVPPGTGTGKQNDRPAAPAASPTPPPSEVQSDPNAVETGEVIEVDTRLVTIPVRILDRKNRFIAGLGKESFKVFEDGVEQEIAYFTNEAQPFTVALVLDMSYSTTFKISEIQSAAISFIDQLRPEDKVMVISFDEEVHMLCEATSDRNTIYRAIRSTRVSTGTSLYEAVAMTMNDRLRSIRGRKAIVLFTDGVDTTSTRSNDLANVRDAMEIDALIYPIRYDTFADVQSMKNKSTIALPAPGRTTTPPTIPTGGNYPTSIPQTPGPVVRQSDGKGTTLEEYRRAEEYLDKLATFTGGTIYLASSLGNLNNAFSKIAGELREFYSLGYYPTSEGVPGKTRRIKVRVNKPDVAIRARDSYVVPKKRKLRTS